MYIKHGRVADTELTKRDYYEGDQCPNSTKEYNCDKIAKELFLFYLKPDTADITYFQTEQSILMKTFSSLRSVFLYKI